jgi:methyl-accepting chemotaxis protein
MQLAAAEPPARIKPDDTSTAQVSPEPPMSLETMARDLAELERKVELLHAMVSDNAKAVEQIQENHQQVVRDIARNAELLKASQEQVAKLAATTSQQNLRPRTSGPEPQPPSGALKPVPTPASSHANARPQAPTQLRPEQR